MKRILALFLVFALFIQVIPASAVESYLADTSIGMEETWASAGSDVQVDIFVEGNPGIIGGTLTVSWPDVLTLVDDKNGEAFSELTYQAPSRYVNTGTNFVWYGSDVEEVKDGTVLSLTFEVSEEASNLEEYYVEIKGDGFTDLNAEPVDVEVNGGYIRVINYKPGDVSGDNLIQPLDLVMLARYISDGCITDPDGYNITINESAADVNDDGQMTPTDLVLISRYISDGCVTDPNGYNVELKPSSPRCKHSMSYTPATEATCEAGGNIEYWYCSLCEKYFADENGKKEIAEENLLVPASHNLEHLAEKAPTHTERGNIDCWHCLICDKYFAEPTAETTLKESQVFTDPLQRTESTVVYNVYGSDAYLESVGVNNTMNPTKFYSADGLILNDLIAPAGYVFKGWTTAAGEPITEIAPSNTSRQIVVNATWEKVEYTITFDSPDVPVESIKYTVDTGATLKNAEWYGYTFVGWSNDDGFLIKSIKPGTTGNITLHANWTSNRSRATSYSADEPLAIIEDDVNSQFLFVYNIGKIDNVPLSVIEYIGNSQKIEINNTYEVTNTISETEANTVAEMISEATTKSSGWTLSKDWNEIYEAGSEYDETRGKTKERTDSEGNVTGGSYYVSNSQGGSTYTSTESGGSSSNSSKVTTDASVGINSNYKASTDTTVSASLGVKNETELSAGVKYGPASAGVKNTTTISAETNATRNDKESFELDTQKSYAIGTVDESHSDSYYNVSVQDSSNWNTTSGYEKSQQSSKETSITDAISEQISKKTTLNVSESVGGAVANSTLDTDTTGKTNEYSTAFGYAKGTGETTSKAIKFSSDRPGYYRLVNAGTVHVFGVVGYDIATDSYYTFTYSILDDERHPYLDYSKDNALFNDCQNAVVPFEVPYNANEYILAVTGKTKGLQVNPEGYITGYSGSDTTVVVPQYWQVNNYDGTFSAIKVCGISETAFAGNTSIEKIVLPKYITEIPASAFEGCTSLETVFASGVTSIGANAFKGCTSLATFTLDEYVTSLGDNAFDGVAELVVMAANESVVDAVINSGAEKITLNLSKLETPLSNRKIEIGTDTDEDGKIDTPTASYFALISNGTVYDNVQVVSLAEETFLSNFALVGNADTPLEIASENITLNRVIVQDAPGFAMVLTADETEVKLFGNNELSSKGENAVLCRNINLSLLDSSMFSKAAVTGNVLCCGSTSGTSLFEINNGELKRISDEEYDQYRTSVIVSFDSNGGSEVAEEVCVYYGQAYGDLPVPERNNHGFVGWFTEVDGGTQITSESIVDALVNQTLYAHWAPNQFTLTYDANGGTCASSTKALTFGDSLGELPVPTRTHYTFNGWYTEPDGGTKVTADTIPESSDNISIYAQWTLVPYEATWSGGTGYTITVKRTASPNANASIGTISSGTKIYYGDVLSVTYTKQDYYTITGSGVTSVTVTGDVNSSSIYATATLNAVSGWVKANAVPSGGQVTSRKYSYTQRTYTESTYTSMSGWNQYSSYWSQSGGGSFNYASFPSGFNTSHSIYQNFHKSCDVSSYENTTNKRAVSTWWSGYVYWHWMYNVAYANEPKRAISSKSGTHGGLAYNYFYAFTSSVDCPYLDKYYCNNQNLAGYNCHSILPKSTSTTDGMGCPRFFRFDYYTCSYTDYVKIFQYYKDTNHESTGYPSGNNISNIVEWVQYRPK